MQSDQVSNMWSFQQNLKALKSKINKWNKEEFGNIFQEKRRLEILLHEIQTIGLNEGYSQALIEEERLVETQLEECEKQGNSYGGRSPELSGFLKGRRTPNSFIILSSNLGFRTKFTPLKMK